MKNKEINTEILKTLTNIEDVLLQILRRLEPKTENPDIEEYKAQYEVPSSANFLSEDFGVEDQIEFDHK
jgi:hypothetical protein